MEFCSVNPTKAQHLKAGGEGKLSGHTRTVGNRIRPSRMKVIRLHCCLGTLVLTFLIFVFCFSQVSLYQALWESECFILLHPNKQMWIKQWIWVFVPYSSFFNNQLCSYEKNPGSQRSGSVVKTYCSCTPPGSISQSAWQAAHTCPLLQL